MPNILMARIDNRLVHGQIGRDLDQHPQRQPGGGGQRRTADPVQQNLMDMGGGGRGLNPLLHAAKPST